MVARFPMISEPERLLVLLTGSVPLLPEYDSKEITFDRDEGLYVLTLVSGNVIQTVKVRPDARTVAGARMEKDGETVLKLTFSGSRKAGDRTVPKRLRLEAPNQDLDVSLDYRDVEFGYQFKGDPFSFECPKGTNVRWLECFLGE